MTNPAIIPITVLIIAVVGFLAAMYVGDWWSPEFWKRRK